MPIRSKLVEGWAEECQAKYEAAEKKAERYRQTGLSAVNLGRSVARLGHDLVEQLKVANNTAKVSKEWAEYWEVMYKDANHTANNLTIALKAATTDLIELQKQSAEDQRILADINALSLRLIAEGSS